MGFCKIKAVADETGPLVFGHKMVIRFWHPVTGIWEKRGVWRQQRSVATDLETQLKRR
jgi:hypothetical protein